MRVRECVIPIVLFLVANTGIVGADEIEEGTMGQDYVPCRTGHTGRSKPLESVARLVRESRRGFKNQAADSDGIERTQGCTTKDGASCSMCCNGKCCERLSDFSGAVKFDADEQLWIPLKFTRLLPATGGSNLGFGRPEIDVQIRALNTIFADSKAPFRFHFESYTVLRDAKAYTSCNTDPCLTAPLYEKCDFYTYTVPKIRADNGNSEKLINVFLCDGFNHYSGEAQYPWASTEDHDHQYLTMTLNAFGNMSDPLSSVGQYKTMVHEMGHYLGLLHTFAPGNQKCDSEGDFVDDTPTSAKPVKTNSPCSTVQDSCTSSSGNDQRENYMNYAKDSCRTSFTEGQVERMERAVSMFRPKLRANTRVVGAGGDCGSTATEITNCVCPTKFSSCTAKNWCRGHTACDAPGAARQVASTTRQSTGGGSSSSLGWSSSSTTDSTSDASESSREASDSSDSCTNVVCASSSDGSDPSDTSSGSASFHEGGGGGARMGGPALAFISLAINILK